MTTVTKKELAYRISEKTGQKKVVIKKIIQAFIDEIIDELAQGNRLEFREFGVFEIKTRAARKARNPRTGVRVDVPSKSVVHFKAGRLMKERVQLGNEAIQRGGSVPVAGETLPSADNGNIQPAAGAEITSPLPNESNPS
jgi:integration host factor subunit beta